MRLWGWVFLLGGIAAVILSLNLDSFAIMAAGSLEGLNDPDISLNKVRLALIGGFAFVGGAVLIGCAGVSAAIRRDPGD